MRYALTAIPATSAVAAPRAQAPGQQCAGKIDRVSGFDGIGHGPSKPKSHRATMVHNLEWFDQYLFRNAPKPSTANQIR